MPALTVQDMVLLHLSRYSIYRDRRVVPEAITQAGIAEAVGVKRPHISVELKRMREEKGWIEEKKAHAGPGNKKKVYFNLPAGEERVRDILRRLDVREVGLEMDGKEYTVKGRQAVDILTKSANLQYPMAVREVLSRKRLSVREILRMNRERYSSPMPLVKHLFGREQEERRIKDWLSGETPVLSLIGPGGVGKSSLVAKVASEQRFPVFWKRVSEGESEEDLMNDLADFFQRNGEEEAASHIRAGEPGGTGRCFSSLEMEYLLVIDDYQNASTEIKEAIKGIKHCLTVSKKGTKMIVISRAIPDFYDKKDIVIERSVEEMFLRGLSREAAEEMLHSLKAYPGEEEFRKIYARSAGHPMILRIAASSRGDGLKEIKNYLTKEFYEGLRPEEREILARLSVFREPVPSEAFLYTDEESEALDSMMERGLVHRDHRGAYFTHDLIREAFMANRDLKDEHLAAAEYYESEEGRQVERIYHLIMGNDIETAERQLRENAEEILSRGNAKALIEALKNAPDTAVFLSVRALAIATSGSLDDAVELAERAIELEDERNRTYALARLGAIYRMKGDYERAERTIKEAIMQEKDETERMRATARLAENAFFMGRYRKAEELASIALEYFESAGLEYDRDATMSRMAMAIARQGRYEEALSILKDCAAGYERRGNYRTLGAIYNQMAMYEAYLGRRNEARRHFEMAALYGDLTGYPRLTATAMMNSADNYLHLGEPEKALSYAKKARDILRDTGDRRREMNALTVIAIAYMKMGDVENGHRVYEEAEKGLKELEEHHVLADMYMEMAEIERNTAIKKNLLRKAIEAYEKVGYEKGINEARSRLEGL